MPKTFSQDRMTSGGMDAPEAVKRLTNEKSISSIPGSESIDW